MTAEPVTAAPAYRQVDMLTGQVADLKCQCSKLSRWYTDAMTALDGMRLSRDDARAELGHSEGECRATAAALVLSHEKRDELQDRVEQLLELNEDQATRLEVFFAQLEELRARLDELEGALMTAPVTAAETRGGGVPNAHK